MSCVANPCKICKNAEFCKYVITDQRALSGLRIGDGNGPFYISVDCKYRNITNIRASNETMSKITGENWR
jgi:hypothetical protein